MTKYVNAKKYLMDKKLKDQGLEYLKSKQMYRRNIKDFLLILDLEFWQDGRYENLLTSNIWSSSVDNIIKIITLECWNIPKYNHLLGSTIFNYKAENIKENIDLFTKLGLDDYLNTALLKRTAVQNFLIIKSLQERCIPVVVKSSRQGDENYYINPIFRQTNINLKGQYGIDLKLLEAEYRLERVKNR